MKCCKIRTKWWTLWVMVWGDGWGQCTRVSRFLVLSLWA